MEIYDGMKLKRKDLDVVNDDLFDFSLSFPARKIRRLDAELPPIIEEEEAEIPLGYEHSVSEGAISNGYREELKTFHIEELPFIPQNDEKAIVPFKPVNGLLLHNASGFAVDPNLISCFKNQAILGARLSVARLSEEDEPQRNDNREVNTCRAVIPWLPSQHLDQRPPHLSPTTQLSESMAAEEMEEAAMEIENDLAPNVGQQVNEHIIHPMISEGLQQQWQQQHCMIPRPPQNITTPIVWYR